MDLAETGKTILRLRKSAGFTQASLAEKLGVSDKAVSKWERGLACPDVTLWKQLSFLLDTDIENMLYGRDMSENWKGVLVLDERIPSDIMVYNKPLINYLVSQFILAGISDIVIIGDCNEIKTDRITVTYESKLNHRFTKNTFIIYGNQFVYGPNLTRHFERAMSRGSLTVIAAMRAKGKFGLSVNSEKKAVLSLNGVDLRYYALPYAFIPSGNIITDEFSALMDNEVYAETFSRGMIHFELNDYESVYSMAGFVKMMEESTGEKISDLDEVISRRIKQE